MIGFLKGVGIGCLIIIALRLGEIIKLLEQMLEVLK